MYTIFFEDKPIHLITDCSSNCLKMEEIDLIEKMKALEGNYLDELCLCNTSLDVLWGSFKKEFKLIDAAGGIVKNENNEILFIYRNDKWDLPKGKVEKGESIENTAVREVEEECGIRDISVINKLNNTFHIYKHKGIYVLKTTYWYMMHTTDISEPTPQLEEGITQVKWIAQDNIPKVLKNTYANIVMLLNEHAKEIFSF